MKNKILSLPYQMAFGMIAGILIGFVAPYAEINGQIWFKPLGDLFITLVRMIVVPLVLTTIIAGAAGINDLTKLGRVAGKTVLYYFLTTAVAILVGLFMADYFQPGQGISLNAEALIATEVKAPSFIQTILNIVPVNPIDASAKGNMLQVIFFAVMFGFALSSIGEKGRPLVTIIELIGEVMVRLTNIIMLFAPIGVFGLMAYTVSNHGLAILLPLIKLIGVMYAASLVHVFVCYVPIARFIVKLSVIGFLKGIITPVVIAFTTASSAAALPMNLHAVRKLGASKAVSSFTISLGNTINMDGTALYMSICAVFAAGVFGIDLSLTDYLAILLTGVLASIGTAGVPSAGLIMISIVFAQVGIPLEAVALIAGVDRILDMARTTLNVTGDATAAILISKLENEFGTEPYDESSEQSELDTGTDAFKL